MEKRFAATSDQVREIDRVAIEQYGVSGLILMENAGHRCACAAADMLGSPEGKKVTVLCGGGNNGGDGFVVARHLTNWGADVQVVLLAEINRVLRVGNETSVNLRIALNMGIPVREALSEEQLNAAFAGCAGTDLVVDALLGTGAQGTVREPFLSAIKALNACGRPVLAVDVPSGLDCNTGQPLGAAVRAHRTVTFVFNKIGFTVPGAEEFTGEVQVAEISIPRAAIQQVLGSCGTALSHHSESHEEGSHKPRSSRRTRRRRFDELSNRVIGCALEAHRSLGPGLLESTYEQCLAHELSSEGIPFKVQWPLPVEYKGLRLDCGYRVDFLVDDKLIVEIKSVGELHGIHEAQLLTYMKLAGASVGLLINFNVALLKNGIRRFVL